MFVTVLGTRGPRPSQKGINADTTGQLAGTQPAQGNARRAELTAQLGGRLLKVKELKMSRRAEERHGALTQ